MTAEALAPDGSRRCVAALDVGGSAVKTGYLTADRVLHARGSVPIGSVAAGGEVVAGLLEVAANIVRHPPPGLRPQSVAMVVPGIVDLQAGKAVYSTMLGWRDVPFRHLLHEATGLPAHLGHDVGAAAAAEAELGAARGHRDWIFLALGTGLGAALVLDGQAYRGSNGWGGELGHVVVDPGGPPCPCGKAGCLETLASASGIVSGYRSSTGRTVTAADVARLAVAGDPAAEQVWQRAATALATGLAAAVEILNPSLVVVGGGMAAAGDQLLDPLSAGLERRVAFVQPTPRVVAGHLGVGAGTYGAGLLGWHHLGQAAR